MEILKLGDEKYSSAALDKYSPPCLRNDDKEEVGDNQGFIELGRRGFAKLFFSKGERERHLSAEQPLGHSVKQQLQAHTFPLWR